MIIRDVYNMPNANNIVAVYREEQIITIQIF